MRLRDAKKLHNNDEVLVDTSIGWVTGRVLGSPHMINNRLQIPVITRVDGFKEVDYLDVR